MTEDVIKITEIQIWTQIERLLKSVRNADDLTVVSMLQHYIRLRNGLTEDGDAVKCCCCGEKIPEGKVQVMCPWCASGIIPERNTAGTGGEENGKTE